MIPIVFSSNHEILASNIKNNRKMISWLMWVERFLEFAQSVEALIGVGIKRGFLKINRQRLKVI